VLRVDERQCEERPAVLLPSREHGQLVEPRRSVYNFGDGPTTNTARAEFQSFERERALPPERGGSWRQKRFGNVDGPADERFRLRAKRLLDAPLRPEEVGDDGVAAAFDVSEEERGAAPLDDATVNLREFEIGVNFRSDFDEVSLTTEQFEKRAEVSMHAAAS
jgi:hypothetical protein